MTKPEIITEAKRLRAAGLTLCEIAERLRPHGGPHRNTLSEWLNGYKKPRPKYHEIGSSFAGRRAV